MHKHRVLLLNAANMESFPVYPYAFVQVPAVARRANIEVVCQDLLAIPAAEWPGTIKRLQEQHEPAMFLITLRNTDSMNYVDYQPEGLGKDAGKAYFPIEETKRLIDTIRALSDKPITVGGFGFSILAKELMSLLRPDFGVVGGADEFFLHFQDIIQGDYRQVANLLYFIGDEVVANERIYFPPSPEIEYTPQGIKEMMAFYDRFPEPGFKGAPLEIMRGCNHACVFCCEPFVAGRKVQYRELETIMGEIELLVENGITEMYMISSELNPEGNDFVLQLAERIEAFNEQQPATRQVTWFGANYLLKFDYDDHRRLYASGFTGGWFDITGLDDRNARAMRTPYRNDTLLSHLKDYLQYQREEVDHSAAIASGVREDEAVRWTMFLGNPASTMETVRETIARANHEGLATSFDRCYIVRPIRVFDYEEPSGETLEVTFSINNRLQHVAYQQSMPSFAYPAALLKHLGSEAAIESMFDHIGETYLSRHYEETRDWPAFLEEQAPELLAGHSPGMGERPSPEQAKERIDGFLREFLRNYRAELAAAGLPSTWAGLEQLTPYTMAAALYGRWDSESAVREALCEQMRIGPDDERQQLVDFFVKTILYRFGVQMIPEYRALFEVPSAVWRKYANNYPNG
jgi:hypothetical protein